jgi:glycolate oxidase FAD binding subunit
VRGSAGLGRVHAVLPARATPAQITGIGESVRHVLGARGGRAVIVSAPPELARELDMAGRLDFF